MTPARFGELLMTAARGLSVETLSDAPMLIASTLRHTTVLAGDAPPSEYLLAMGRSAVLWGGRAQDSSDALTAALLRLPEFRDPVASAVTGCVDRARRRLAS